MRRLVLVAASTVLAGCAAPHSDGGLWARQALQQELALSRLAEGQRAATAHAFELQLADEALDAEQARIEQCRPPASSTLRDSILIRIADDPPRQLRVAQQALADAYLRQAQCDNARAALAGAIPAQLRPLELTEQTELVERAFAWSDPPP